MVNRLSAIATKMNVTKPVSSVRNTDIDCLLEKNEVHIIHYVCTQHDKQHDCVFYIINDRPLL